MYVKSQYSCLLSTKPQPESLDAWGLSGDISRRIHSGTWRYTRLRFYYINQGSFEIAYHGLNDEIHSSTSLSKWKCKAHCCNFKVFKVTSLQSLAWPGFKPCLPRHAAAWVNFPMLSDSRGRPRFKSRPGLTLKICNFEALEVTAMYFTFLETSNLFLFEQ